MRDIDLNQVSCVTVAAGLNIYDKSITDQERPNAGDLRSFDVQYQQRQLDGFTIIELNGRIDLFSSPGFRRRLLKLIRGNNNLLVDLSQVSYIDSSGVACLVEAYQMARGKSLRFGLIGINDSVRNILKLARLDQVFPIHDSIEAGVRQS